MSRKRQRTDDAPRDHRLVEIPTCPPAVENVTFNTVFLNPLANDPTPHAKQTWNMIVGMMMAIKEIISRANVRVEIRDRRFKEDRAGDRSSYLVSFDTVSPNSPVFANVLAIMQHPTFQFYMARGLLSGFDTSAHAATPHPGITFQIDVKAYQ